MAPSRTSTVRSKHASKHAKSGSGIKNSKAADARATAPGVSKSKAPKTGKGSIPLRGSGKTGKAFGGGRDGGAAKGVGSGSTGVGGIRKPGMRDGKKVRRVYTEKELGIPALNMITPVGVEKPRGKKVGKVFVDDRESMLTILALVNAEKDGQIESKMMRARQMEEIREARKAEAEKKMAERKGKLEETKEGLRRKRRRGEGDGDSGSAVEVGKGLRESQREGKAKRKSVSFA